MKKQILSLALIVSFACAFDANLSKSKNKTGINLALKEWILPDGIDEMGILDESKIANSPYGENVILGYKILTQTQNYIGPKAKDESKRYAGNNLSCSSCHANAGIKPYSAGFVGIVARFPQYNARADKIITLENRINGCMERSMNGRMMPINSPEMKAMVTYMHWLSQNTPVGGSTKGQGLAKVNLLDRKADPIKGKAVYEMHCLSCHGENGEGIKNDDYSNQAYYIYPPLWGEDSYNTGAGMYRLIKAAQFIKQNMPQYNEILTDEEAFDVASYINTQKRPVKDGRDEDFPNRAIKPVDMDVGPYDDKFSEEEHRFGPYKQMQK